ncbi:MAG: glycerophosphoryl diester phosphodiesterase, partial [Mycobacterium sp.]|nr:glycerophosphoryl diester phosphodiesterase [Mycobacterium sp.]
MRERGSSDGPPPSRGLSRRALVGGAVGIAALTAVGVPTITALLDAPTGKLVTPLLAARPFYVAHRGGWRNWPEMSMEAYSNSVRRGVDALEVS